ncbi:MAG TPA: GTPase Era [Candidatus Pullichristensenella stercorigallinarum]|uniref:GTPase Era n=1 Tax=Candidatus Pullichristensenella stercorigallinarum TaxID=2840909 RepID=A0A9D0ZJS7_9FIRM|nr:GTPase Era [Candidatus Pullichristensenella stercorigallinarum]
MENKQPFHSGFVAILGRPNVGKSSIMNRFVGEKVAIVSNHPQTTRSRLLGVATHPDWQIVFVDTPGLHKPRTKLGEYMVKAANDAREGVDAVLVVVDGQYIGAGDRAIIADVARMSCPKYLAVNKIDLCNPEKLMPELQKLNDCGFDQIVCVSAKRGDRMDELLAMLVSAMPEGPQYFPDEMMTDQPERVLCAEIIREKALWNLRDEVPHGVGVEMLSIKELRPGLTEIHANIYCERASHKSIIIGKQGSMLGKIGSEARRDIERLLGTQVALKLWVKVREDWRNRAGDLRALGYEED